MGHTTFHGLQTGHDRHSDPLRVVKPTHAESYVESRSPIGSTAPETPPIDFEYLRAAFKQDRQIVRELLTLYLDTTPPLLERLKAAIAQKDAAATKAAHEIKGASGYIAAPEMAVMAREIEQAIKNEDWDAAEQQLERMETAFIRILGFVDQNAAF